MTYKICYWDVETQSQQERDATPIEQAEIDERKAAKDGNEAKSVRQDRNVKLTASDWTQVADAPVDKAAWATYRQALRDITAQPGFPWTVTWPDAPV